MYCDLSAHLETSLQSHLLALAQHTVDQSQTIQKYQRKVSELEDHLSHQSSVMSSLQSTCANNVIQIRNLERALDEKAASADGELATQNRKLEGEIIDLRREVGSLRLLCRTIERDASTAASLNQLNSAHVGDAGRVSRN
jgi:septal ring factor EnvC (AmiA/AmiB activator)